MILVKLKDKEVIVSGHAMYDDYGKDIVCASVSSIINTTVNACMRLNKNSILYNDDKETITIKNKSRDLYTNCLIDNMIELLKQLEIDYPKNIKIESEE